MTPPSRPQALVLLGPAGPWGAGAAAAFAAQARAAAARHPDLPRHADRMVPGFARLHDRLPPERLAAIDALALDTMLAADAALAAAALAAPAGPERDRHAALLGGMRAASNRLAQALKLVAALRALDLVHVVLAGDRDAVAEAARWLALAGIAVRRLPLAAPAAGRRADRLRRTVLARPLAAALGSVLLEALWRWRTRAARRQRARAHEPPPADRPLPLLVEASARLAGFLAPLIDDVHRGREAAGAAFVLRRHQAAHLAPLRRAHPGFAPHFIEHESLRPRLFARWLRRALGSGLGGARLAARARATLAADAAAQAAAGATDAAAEPERALARALAVDLVAAAGRTQLRLWLGAEALLARLRPRALLLSNDIEPSLRLLALAAKARGAPTACLQHGAFSEPLNLDGAAADAYHVWGPAGAAFLRRHGRARIALSTAGHPAHAARAATPLLPAARLPGLPPLALYATRANSTESASYYPDREAEFLALLRSCWPGAALGLAIKPHPRAHRPDWYAAEARAFAAVTGAPARVIADDLLEAMAGAELVIATGGTAVLEAVVLGRTCLFIPPPGRPDLAGWSAFPCLHVVPFDRPERLRVLLAGGSASRIDFAEPAMAAARARFLRAHIGLAEPAAAVAPGAAAADPAA